MVKTKTIPEVMKTHHYLIDGLLKTFIKHQNEPEVFPEKLDEELDESKKKEIMERITNPV